VKCPNCQKNMYLNHVIKIKENCHHFYQCNEVTCPVELITKIVRLEP
jgi:hypothetical protein